MLVKLREGEVVEILYCPVLAVHGYLSSAVQHSGFYRDMWTMKTHCLGPLGK